ncbi:branched-chain amino acid ABC transporter permease [Streptomyces rugosispiralis]|uniref:Branched-chain amino acid ABC transporter permease n=1 Tax=Streptomyces rugosispiralis TaxID=2967341 RepID=A0ABT1V5G5_9ACTN|nr:branched-chain amino acid ABC transporter permease [Streptomyces rugosispiralis]MCQ8192635.1 branched-chain amino acid ABC transporter permease [Streptomyces rugosispiralis]
MTIFVQTVLGGLLLGGVYSLVSAGLALSFGVTNIVDFAHGDFVTVGMYVAVVLGGAGIGPLLSAPVAAIVVALFGILIYTTALRRVVDRPQDTSDARHVPQLVVTFALGIVIQNALLLGFGPDQRTTPGGGHVLMLGPFTLDRAQLIAFCLAVTILGLLLITLRSTPLGRVISAVVDDQEVVTLLGIRSGRLLPLVFAVGLGLTGFAGSVISSYFPAAPASGLSFMTIAFIAVVLGGMRNVLGAVVAAPLIGITQQITATYLSPEIANLGVYAVFITVLLVRPHGLFGLKGLA